MRTIKRYGLMGNMEDAHYIRYAFDAACGAGLAPGRSGTAIANASAPHDVSTGSSMRKVLRETVKSKGVIERVDRPSSEETPAHSQRSAGGFGETTQGQESCHNGGGGEGSLEKRSSGRLAARAMVGVQCDGDKVGLTALPSEFARICCEPIRVLSTTHRSAVDWPQSFEVSLFLGTKTREKRAVESLPASLITCFKGPITLTFP